MSENYVMLDFICDIHISSPNSTCFVLPQGLNHNEEFVEHEIEIIDNTIYWRRGIDQFRRSPCFSFTVDSKINAAVICSFSNLFHQNNINVGELPCLCVVEGSRITAFGQDEDIFNIALPFALKGVWSSVFGLILQREPSDQEKIVLNSKECINQTIDGQWPHSELPILFTLTHPLNEPCHVLYKYSHHEGGLVNYFCNPLIDIIHVNNNPSFVIAYDNVLEQHTIWQMIPASKEYNQYTFPTDSLIHFGQPMSSSAPPRVQHFEVTPFNTPLKLYTPSPNNSKKTSYNPDNLSTPYLSKCSLKNVSLIDISASKMKECLRIATVKRNFIYELSSGGDAKCKFQKALGSNERMRIEKQNSRLGPGNAPFKRTRSLSPNNISFPSPLSRTTPSHFFQAYFSPFDEHTVPVQPEICLLNIYTQPKNEQNFKATKAFRYIDLLFREFVVFVDTLIEKVWLLEIQKPLRVTRIEFGNSYFINATDAVSLDSLRLLLCLHLSDNSLHLYSCNTPICRIVSGYVSKPIRICDPVLDRITLAFLDGSSKRYRVPNISDNSTVNLIISSFSHVLPHNQFHQFLLETYICSNKTCTYNFQDFLILIQNHTGFMMDNFFDMEELSNRNIIHFLVKQRAYLLPVLKFQFQPHLKILFNFSKPTNDSSSLLRVCSDKFFIALHIILEEIMIGIFSMNEVVSLIKFLFLFVNFCSLSQNYLDYYSHLVSFFHFSTQTPIVKSNSYSIDMYKELRKFSLFYWLTDHLINLFSSCIPFPYIPQISTKTFFIICIYLLLFVQFKKYPINQLCAYVENISLLHCSRELHSKYCKDFDSLSFMFNVNEMLATYIIHHKIDKLFLSSICPPYSIPILNFFDLCRLNPPRDASNIFYLLLDRSDIYFHEKCSPYSNSIFQYDMFELKNLINSGFQKGVLNLLFPHDNRAIEVYDLLDSSKQIQIDVEQSPSMSDEDFHELQSNRLLKLLIRSLALPIGRGMFNYGVFDMLHTEKIFLPILNLSGKALSTNATVTTDNTDKPLQLTLWPEFHNGVAAGLTLNPFSNDVDTSWIQFNQPIPYHQNEYAGFLMAMGLQGHLSSLSKFTMHDFLSRGHEFTLVGLLLGIAATKRTSMDQDITRMLSIHVRSLQPESSMELEISPNVQTAAILSVGLLYQGTSNRHIVDVLLNEISSFSSSEMENIFDRRSRCLSSGFALGLTLLGKGRDKKSTFPLRIIAERLSNNILGTLQQKDLDSSVISQQISDEGFDIMSIGPGSLMALSMIYIKSGDQSISNFLKPKNSYFLLDEIHPYILILQTISYCLVQWNNIKPNIVWLHGIIPQVLIDNIKRSRNELIQDGMDVYVVRVIYFQILVGCLFSIGLRFAGSHDQLVYSFISGYLLQFIDDINVSKIVSDSRINCTLIACSLVMCGTGDKELLKVIYKLRRISKEHNDFHFGYGNQMAYHMALGLACLGKFQYNLRTSDDSIAYLLISLFPIFPNNSYEDIYLLQAFRHLYVLSIDRKFLFLKDIHSNEPCAAEVCIVYEFLGTEYSRRLRIPFLVPETYNLKSILIHSDYYWPTEIRGDVQSFTKLYRGGGLIFLLKKTLFLENAKCCFESLLDFLFISNLNKFYQSACFLSIFLKPNPNENGYIDKYFTLHYIGSNNKLIWNTSLCISTNLESPSFTLNGCTFFFQPLIFLYYYFNKNRFGMSHKYAQKFVQCMNRNFHQILDSGHTSLINLFIYKDVFDTDNIYRFNFVFEHYYYYWCVHLRRFND